MANTLKETFDIFQDLYKDNQVVFLGDTNHGDQRFRDFLKISFPELEKAKVTDVFLEHPKEYQPYIDKFFAAKSQSGEMEALNDLSSVMPLSDNHIAFFHEAKRHGINVHYMDVKLTDEENKSSNIVRKYQTDEAYQTNGQFDYKKLSKADKAEYNPAYDMLFDQRERVNQDWVDTVKAVKEQHPDGKFLVFGGDLHARRKFLEGKSQKDVDELLGDQVGKTAYVRLATTPEDDPIIKKKNELSAPARESQQLPDVVIHLPPKNQLASLHRDYKAHAHEPENPQKSVESGIEGVQKALESALGVKTLLKDDPIKFNGHDIKVITFQVGTEKQADKLVDKLAEIRNKAGLTRDDFGLGNDKDGNVRISLRGLMLANVTEEHGAKHLLDKFIKEAAPEMKEAIHEAMKGKDVSLNVTPDIAKRGVELAMAKFGGGLPSLGQNGSPQTTPGMNIHTQRTTSLS